MDPQLDAPSAAHSWLGPPIDARPLFVPEHAALIATLRELTPADWGREAVPGWSVRDVAAHVLGDCYGRLARHRDGQGEGGREAHREGRREGDGEGHREGRREGHRKGAARGAGTAADGGNWSLAGPGRRSSRRPRPTRRGDRLASVRTRHRTRRRPHPRRDRRRPPTRRSRLPDRVRRALTGRRPVTDGGADAAPAPDVAQPRMQQPQPRMQPSPSPRRNDTAVPPTPGHPRTRTPPDRPGHPLRKPPPHRQPPTPLTAEAPRKTPGPSARPESSRSPRAAVPPGPSRSGRPAHPPPTAAAAPSSAKAPRRC